MKASSKYVLREIAGEIMLVPVGLSEAKINGLIALNQTGGFIFKALSENRTIEELIEMVTFEYEIDAELARKDVEDFLKLLRQVNALIDEE